MNQAPIAAEMKRSAGPLAPTIELPAMEPMGLPRAPVLGWRSLRGGAAPAHHAVDGLPHTTYLTSGRAAIYHALRQIALPPGTPVLVPTYHCPTIIAPVLLAGLTPAFFPVDARGLPKLDALHPSSMQARAIIVPHYFGLPQSLLEIRRWCDAQGVVLIEDCAHSLFGIAGERPVGLWGDFATASLSKFLPVPEAGVLASANRNLTSVRLESQGALAETKAFIDVLEIGAKFHKLGALNGPVNLAFRVLRGSPPPAAPAVPKMPDAEGMMRGCDMARIGSRPLMLSRWIARRLPRERVVQRRRENFRRYLEAFRGSVGVEPLRRELAPTDVPYVFPLCVDAADFVYHRLRERAAPVFRWDHIWPGTPSIPGDVGPIWSRRVLQLLCHQDLEPHDIDRVTAEILRAVSLAGRVAGG